MTATLLPKLVRTLRVQVRSAHVDHLSDAQLLERFSANGDEAAFERCSAVTVRWYVALSACWATGPTRMTPSRLLFWCSLARLVRSARPRPSAAGSTVSPGDCRVSYAVGPRVVGIASALPPFCWLG